MGDQGLSREWGFPQPHSGIVDTRDQEERKQKKPESAMTLQLRARAEKRKMWAVRKEWTKQIIRGGRGEDTGDRITGQKDESSILIPPGVDFCFLM